MTTPTMLLDDIREGMTVYDKHSQQVGTVDFIHPGGGRPGMASSGAEARQAVATARERLPADVIDRLLSHAFVKVSTPGFFP